MTAPPLQTERIIQLDALRGVAVMGIVWMNVYVFALPSQAYYNPLAWGGETEWDRLIWAVSFIFVEDKFRTLFALLFGAGCLILLERAEARQVRAHFARMAVLFVIGLVHSIFLASNDVLRAYALAGLVLPFVAKLSSKELYALAVGLVIFHCAASMVVFGSGIVDVYAGRTTSDAYLLAERNFGLNEAALRVRYEIGSEGLLDRIYRRSMQIPGQLRNVAASIPLNLAAMLLGMALWKDRMLAVRWRTFRLQRLAALCALIALPALFGLQWWVFRHDFAGAIVGASALMLSAPFDMLLGLVYALLAMAFFTKHGPITKRLASVGRLSLTNYLATSVILAFIFASWGLGLFGEVSRSMAFAVSFIPIVGMLLWSPAWVARYVQGPAERFWRRASRFLS